MNGADLSDRMALTAAMAARSGVALDVAVSADDAQRMARLCADCNRTETCRLALIAGRDRDIPGYCLNREMIETLAVRR